MELGGDAHQPTGSSISQTNKWLGCKLCHVYGAIEIPPARNYSVGTRVYLSHSRINISDDQTSKWQLQHAKIMHEKSGESTISYSSL